MNKNKKNIVIVVTIIILMLISGIIIYNNSVNNHEYINYKEFYENIENNNIESVKIEKDKVEFKIKDDNNLYYTDNPNYENFKRELLLKDIQVKDVSNDNIAEEIYNIAFNTIFFALIIFGITKLCSYMRKTFKVIKKVDTRFSDIAGMDDLKKDMKLVVEVLKNPKEYKEKGIRQIKGIIFEGPPGNGKTLFAKALAGEAHVNFIATKGADFQSAMMSGGSRKIKALLRKARKNSPCIIFIDEFDGIGEKRNYTGTGVDKENNRIITALLSEMDGFNTLEGVLIIGATNSYNSLDPALIRPGRFDMKYTMKNPDKETRLKLIDLYTKKKKLDVSIDKDKLADAFDNLSSSAVETVLNEAAMIAITQNHDNILKEDILVASLKTNCNINVKKLK